MNREQILERERRWARPAAFAAIAVPVLYIVATAVGQSVDVPDGLPTDQIVTVATDSGTIFAASVLRALSALAFLPALYLLFRAAQARSERVQGPMIGFVFLTPLALAISTIVLYAGQDQLATDFVTDSAAGGDVYNLFDDLLGDNTLVTVGQALTQLAGLALVVTMVYVPLQAYRVGLLTRFFGTLGMAFGVIALLIPQIGMLPLVIWFGWLGFVILDRVPRGRPPAWDAGVAIPWPRPGEEPQPATATAEGDSGVVEGDATEAFESTAERDNTARRERAKKRKRKRRK
jgi:hypothetical protein